MFGNRYYLVTLRRSDTQLLQCSNMCFSYLVAYMAKVKKTAAQKQREYRARRDSDPERRVQYLEKERASWAIKKANQKWHPMSSLSERDKRIRKRKNREAQRRYRHRQSVRASAVTPPATPASSVQDQVDGHSSGRSWYVSLFHF